jgi:transposase
MKSEGLTISEIAERVIDEFGIVVSFEAIQRWVRKAKESQEEEK